MTTRPHRFFVSPNSITDKGATFTGAAAHQMHAVLRLRAGERVVLLDGSGWEFEVELGSVNAAEVSGRVVGKRLSKHEPLVRITLYQALLKLDKFEWVLQKGTEIGIAAFRPLLSERVVRDALSAKKLERWQRIVREAAEQSERGIIPHLTAPLAFAEAVQAAQDGLALIPYEEERVQSLRAVLRKGPASLRDPSAGSGQAPSGLSVHLFIGPEGGFNADEIAFAKQHRIIPLTLGPRILRAETAGLVVASAILYELGELESAVGGG